MSRPAPLTSRFLVGFEDLLLGGFALVLLLAAAFAQLAESRFASTNPRLVYGVAHLPNALLAASLFVALAAVVRWALTQRNAPRNLTTIYFVAAVAAVFCLFWLPAVLAGGFDRDDWMLLAAASVRRILIGHPALAWQTLDSVDGNFRPLGTVLYVGYMLRHFGVWARPFLLGLFAINLLGSLTAFAIVRSLGYSRLAAAAGAILYLSRSEIYTIVTWTCALGDALVILLCGLMALALMAAIRHRGPVAWALHLAAWVCFCAATLAKQSSFAGPLIVGLLLLLRPGTDAIPPLAGRIRTAFLGVSIYAAAAAVPFFHAKRLLASPPPYPIGFSFGAVLRVFGYAAWYLGTFEFPMKYERLQTLPSIVGIVVVSLVGTALWRQPKLLGDRPRDVLFCLLAAVASVSLFFVLPARVAAYYGSMAGFWMSIALGIALTRFGWATRNNLPARLACLAFCGLVAVGFIDVRLKQTGLFPAGGYTWGAAEVGIELDVYQAIARALARAPTTETLLLEDMPSYDAYFAGMAMTADPHLKRILAVRSNSTSFKVNDLAGAVPSDDLAALRDPKSYNWDSAIDAAEARRLLASGKVLRLKFHNGKIESGN